MTHITPLLKRLKNTKDKSITSAFNRGTTYDGIVAFMGGKSSTVVPYEGMRVKVDVKQYATEIVVTVSKA